MKTNSLLSRLLVGLMLPFVAISAAQADLLSEIKKKGEIVIATEARYAPFEMLQDGKIVGYSKDILDEIMKGICQLPKHVSKQQFNLNASVWHRSQMRGQLSSPVASSSA